MLAGVVAFIFKFSDLNEFIKIVTFKPQVIFLANFVKIFNEAGDLVSWVRVFWM